MADLLRGFGAPNALEGSVWEGALLAVLKLGSQESSKLFSFSGDERWISEPLLLELDLHDAIENQTARFDVCTGALASTHECDHEHRSEKARVADRPHRVNLTRIGGD